MVPRRRVDFYGGDKEEYSTVNTSEALRLK